MTDVAMTPTIRHARTTDGVRIAWTSVGSGPALIHLPGIPFGNLEAEWRIPVLQQAFASLARSVSLIQYDARGGGRSDRAVADLSFEAMLRDVDAVAGAVRADQTATGDPLALLGFYNSVPLAIAYAARHPERVGRLVLFGGSVRGWNPMSGSGTQALLSLIDRDWDTFAESAAHAWLGWPDGESGRLAADWFRNATTPEVAREILGLMSAVDVAVDARRVRGPVLVLHRLDASVIPLAVSEELAAAFPDGRVRILDGSSAGLFFERPDTAVRQIARFVTEGATEPDSDSRAGVDPEAGPAGPGRPIHPTGSRPLTRRELEVIRQVAHGGTNADIATALGVSVHTVERHLVNIYRKIDARGRADATAYAVRRGLA